MGLLTPIRRVLERLLLAALFCAASHPEAGAQSAEPYPEYAVKAAFLYNFCQFTTWPAASFPSPNAPITIGIFGSDPFGKLIEKAVTGQQVGGRSIRISRLRGGDEARQCHVIFIPRAAAGTMNALLTQLKGQNVLTVGETEDFLRAGGMIALATDEGKVRLRINVQAVRGTALVLSSKLLRLANR